MQQQLGWAYKLRGEEPLLASLMESQIWHQLTSFVGEGEGEGSAKGQCLLLALMPDTAVLPSMPLVG